MIGFLEGLMTRSREKPLNISELERREKTLKHSDLLEKLDEEAGERMMERLKEFRVEGKLSNRARTQ